MNSKKKSKKRQIKMKKEKKSKDEILTLAEEVALEIAYRRLMGEKIEVYPDILKDL